MPATVSILSDVLRPVSGPDMPSVLETTPHPLEKMHILVALGECPVNAGHTHWPDMRSDFIWRMDPLTFTIIPSLFLSLFFKRFYLFIF